MGAPVGSATSGRNHGMELFLRSARAVLARDFGDVFARQVIDDARVEYASVRPRVPDIGGRRNVFQPVMTVNGWIVSLHRAMIAHGKKAEDTIRVCHQVFDAWLRKIPAFVLKALGRLVLSAPVRRYFESQARRSQDRRYAHDFVWRVERGSAGELSLVFDECAVNKWYDALGQADLKPYCNFADVTYSRLMGMGVDATQTIGLGCQQCALRFKHGRDTIVPPSLERVFSQD